MRWLEVLGWLACVIYSTIPLFWMVVHSQAERWRSRIRSPYRILVPLWMAMWLVMGLATGRWRQVRLYQSGWTWIPALGLFALGIWLYAQAGKGFSLKQLGGIHEVAPGQQEQRLIVSGIRARVRHPIYLAHFCEMLAWSAGTGLAVCYGLALFALVTGAVMIRMEERELEERLGEAYREYRKRVPALLPRI
jgi:protein-S-isoprenylcysteine O-methyltransferase Ste14